MFNIVHAFWIKNNSKDFLEIDFDGYGDHPYCEDQTKIHQVIVKALKSKGYYQITFAEKEEVVRGFKMPKDVKLYGKDVTVKLLLFIDIYNICQR